MRAKLLLGTPEVRWLWDPDPRFDDITFFVSRNRFALRSPNRTMPRALHPCSVDSGGYTELQKHGRWRTTAQQYANEVRRYRHELGEDKVLWIAPQDWMTEPWTIYGGWHQGQYFAGTREARGLALREPEQDLTTAVRIHIHYTVDNLLQLRRIAPDLPVIPVLQGQTLADYEYCASLYGKAGVELAAEPIVGLGSVCRREATDEIAEVAAHFADRGIRLHGFGVKAGGLRLYGDDLASADSQAWSYGYRRKQIRLPQCTHRAKTCANCKEGAMRWYYRALAKGSVPKPPSPDWQQLSLDLTP
jgi:hypothetical protein